MTSTTIWRSGWTATEPLDIRTGFLAHDDGSWASAELPGLETRDLGLTEASEGRLTARMLRSAGVGLAVGPWGFHDLDFHWFYLVRGSVTVRGESGDDVVLGAHDSAYLPPFWRYQLREISADFEAVEVRGPAEHTTTSGKDAPKPPRAAEFAHLEPVFNLDRPENYVRGDGPRAWVLYRDLQLRVPTEGRIHIHVIKLDPEQDKPDGGGTGQHAHSMAQFFLPLQGWIDISAEGQPDRRVVAGDFMTVQRGCVHDATAASPDYITIEFCIPADYSTEAR